MFLYLEDFQPQNVILLFSMKHSYPSTDKEYDKWRAQRALRGHALKYILQTGKLKNGNFVTIRFKGTELNFGL